MNKPGMLWDGAKQGSSLSLHPWQAGLQFIVRSQGPLVQLLEKEELCGLFLCHGSAPPHHPRLWDFP